MNNDDSMREQVSALADGQLHGADGDAVSRVVGQICSQEDLQETWRTYHLVGDVLRSGTHTACADSGEFVARLRQRLVVEAAPSVVADPIAAVGSPQDAANEPVYRWKMLAGVASLAAAAAIGWNWVGPSAQGPVQAQLAQQAPAAASVGGPVTSGTRVLVGEGQRPQVMLRDPRLDALLEAHQQAGGASTMPSSFLRNATFEAPSR
jgi:sigma-E factor negative regulatory protein RseA